MNKSFAVEYYNLDLTFRRSHIQQFINALIQEGYSLYWKVSELALVVFIRTRERSAKLKFVRSGSEYKFLGQCSLYDRTLSQLLEKLIEDTRGSAVVKRVLDRQVFIESISLGETIRKVEVSGMERKVLYDKSTLITMDEIIRAFTSDRAEVRAQSVRAEIDYELALLQEALENDDAEQIAQIKARLIKLSREMIMLEI